ncbi:MAG: 3-terminal phosphate cyclase [Thermoproteota archaeon]|nr:3-terminal phosphate cyclase [Thermoproteota archaeon]
MDGSWGEGGGQILRIGVALSAVIDRPIRIYDIRAKRPSPGLRPQHETAVRAVAQITNAEVKGLEIGSSEIEFSPNRAKGGKFLFDTGTAASTSLILQSLMPTMTFASKPFQTEIRGGTNNPWAPTVDYIQEILLPTVKKMGYKGSIELEKRGFYPRGGGIVRADATPIEKLNPIILKESGKVTRIRGLAYSSRLPYHIVDRMAKSATKTLQDAGYPLVTIERENLQPGSNRCAIDPGCGIILFAEFASGAMIGSDNLGRTNKPAERVGYEAANGLIEQLKTGCPVDEHLGDQLIVYMALADGVSEINVSKLTLHTTTCVHVAEQIAKAKFQISGEVGKQATIICKGIGYKRGR